MFNLLDIIWNQYLLIPLVNSLIWIYNNLTDHNLGWAVVWLTVLLRFILLPLTIISERNAVKQEKAQDEALEAAQAFRHDTIAQNEEIRKIIKKNKISPWAKVLTLLIQLLVLVLLYQVFVRGITGDRLAKILYPSIDFPGKINTNFFGFEIGHIHDWIWAGICAVYMFAYIVFENRHKKHWENSQVVFLFLFPLFTFTALWILPMVKSLFILTSMIFSDIISILIYVLFSAKPKETGGEGHH
ncbi:MAG: YidC/Oxa1 family membrane protein insertase [Candidatus Magasanikbacteria bacterium]|nr:YidC/Oxa1 family membrane protein insertase [Candidatus Magasanikbacteria bacterium]